MPAAWRLGFWKLSCGRTSAPLGRLYDRDATVNVCFATVYFPTHPQKPDPAHMGLRAWGGAVDLFTQGPHTEVSAAPESSRFPGLQTGSLAGPGHCGRRRGKAAGAGCPQAEVGSAPHLKALDRGKRRPPRSSLPMAACGLRVERQRGGRLGGPFPAGRF